MTTRIDPTFDNATALAPVAQTPKSTEKLRVSFAVWLLLFCFMGILGATLPHSLIVTIPSFIILALQQLLTGTRRMRYWTCVGLTIICTCTWQLIKQDNNRKAMYQRQEASYSQAAQTPVYEAPVPVVQSQPVSTCNGSTYMRSPRNENLWVRRPGC